MEMIQVQFQDNLYSFLFCFAFIQHTFMVFLRSDIQKICGLKKP